MVDPGLPARRGVQVEDHAQTRSRHQPTSRSSRVQPCPSNCRRCLVGRARLGEQPPVQRHAHGIEAGRLDEADVGLVT